MTASSTTIFERMSALARETGAINLGQGFPDLPEPAELLEAAQRALVDKSNQYPPMRGLAALRSAVCAYYRREQGLELQPEEVIVTSGATEALAAAVLGCVFVGLGSAATMFHLGSFWEPDSPADWFTLALVLLAVESNVAVLAASAATPPPLDEDE